MKLEKKTKKALKKQAWDLCSLFVRQRDNGRCFTCGIKKQYKLMHGGHFIHGSTKETYLDEDNVHCQCPRCNLRLSGNLRIYMRNMIERYGLEFVDKLDKSSKKGHYYSRKGLIEKIHYYTEKLKDYE